MLDKTDDELINEVLKRADEFAEKEKKLCAITELEKVKAALKHNIYVIGGDDLIYWEDVEEIISERIKELIGGNDA